MDPHKDAPSDLFLNRLTDAMLALAPESGWTRATLAKAAENAGLTEGQGRDRHDHGDVKENCASYCQYEVGGRIQSAGKG